MDTYVEALDFMMRTPDILRALFASAPREMADFRPAAENWSPRQVLAHMLHAESRVIAPRIEQMLREGDPAFQPAPPMPEPGNAEDVLEEWLQARWSNLKTLRALAPDQLARSGRHAKYGPITAREHIVEWAYHDLDHLRQIFAIYQSALYPDIGGFRSLYPPPAP